MLHEYLWAVILGGIFCFTLGFGMGSNDVSNNFGTSIGSKSITLGKAIIIAGIFELVGAVGFGSSVTDAVRKGIYNPEEFGEMPDFLLIANVGALIAGTSWLLFCSATGQSVSTTHSLVGAMLGCGLALGGRAVNWMYLLKVVMSWFVTPTASFIVGMIYYSLLRKFMLRKENSIKIGFRLLPLLLYVICLSFTLFFIFANPVTLMNTECLQKDSETKEISTKKPCRVDGWVYAHVGAAFGIAVGGAFVLAAIMTPFVWMRAKKTLRKFDDTADADENEIIGVAENSMIDLEGHDQENAIPYKPSQGNLAVVEKRDSLKSNLKNLDQSSVPPSSSPTELTEFKKGKRSKPAKNLEEGEEDLPFFKKLWKRMPWNHDLHAEAFAHDPHAEEIAHLSEKFHPRTECFFNTLQIVSASIACLLHGSNDVANAAAPFASVYSIYELERYEKSVHVPIWILFLGGAAITAGLTIFGHRVIKTVGIELFHVTPARGFCVEMALSTVLIIGTFMGFPLSTTHIGIGAMIGIGLLDKHYDPETGEEKDTKKCFGFINLDAVNWKVFLKLGLAWVGTIVICAAVSCAIFSFAIHTPSKLATRFTPCSSWDPSCVVPSTSRLLLMR